MSVTLLTINVDRHDSLRMWASRSEESAFLAIDTDGTHCEIQLDRAAVQALCDHLAMTLVGLDRVAAQELAAIAANEARHQVVGSTERALELATSAELAGAQEEAAALRVAVEEAKGTAAAVTALVEAFEHTTGEADYAAQHLDYAIRKAHTQLRRLRAEPVAQRG